VKRLRRIIFNVMTILSLLLALAVAAAWASSYLRSDYVSYRLASNHTWVFVDSSRGRAAFGTEQLEYSTRWEKSRWAHKPLSQLDHLGREHAFMGIRWIQLFVPDNWGYRKNSTSIPHAYFLLLFVALPAIRIYRSIRRRLVLAGHCRVCGYDLRATHDRCPECGTVPKKSERISN
jgi:hypothetical protein